jgi:hypothetical protein
MPQETAKTELVSVPTESRPTEVDWAERAAERIYLLYCDSNYFRSMPKEPLIQGWAEIMRTEFFKAPPVAVGFKSVEEWEKFTRFAASSALLPVPENHQAIASFANKVGAALSRHFGESHRGDRPDIDELFDLCEDLSWIACQKIDALLPVGRQLEPLENEPKPVK